MVDTTVIANAPVKFLIAGMGDALGTYFEGRVFLSAPNPQALRVRASQEQVRHSLAFAMTRFVNTASRRSRLARYTQLLPHLKISLKLTFTFQASAHR